MGVLLGSSPGTYFIVVCWIFAVFTKYVGIYQKDVMVLCAAGITGIQAIVSPVSKLIFPPFHGLSLSHI